MEAIFSHASLERSASLILCFQNPNLIHIKFNRLWAVCHLFLKPWWKIAISKNSNQRLNSKGIEQNFSLSDARRNQGLFTDGTTIRDPHTAVILVGNKKNHFWLQSMWKPTNQAIPLESDWLTMSILHTYILKQQKLEAAKGLAKWKWYKALGLSESH